MTNTGSAPSRSRPTASLALRHVGWAGSAAGRLDWVNRDEGSLRADGVGGRSPKIVCVQIMIGDQDRDSVFYIDVPEMTGPHLFMLVTRKKP